MDDFSSLGVKIVCQGERSRLQCDNASKKLTIYSATFGRTEPGNVICPYKKNDTDDNYNCGEVDLTNLFKIFCENKTRCKTKADDINKLGLFKNPCPEQYGYLKLVFSCGKCSLGSQKYFLIITDSSSFFNQLHLTIVSRLADAFSMDVNGSRKSTRET